MSGYSRNNVIFKGGCVSITRTTSKALLCNSTSLWRHLQNIPFRSSNLNFVTGCILNQPHQIFVNPQRRLPLGTSNLKCSYNSSSKSTDSTLLFIWHFFCWISNAIRSYLFFITHFPVT
jgi:hypothetical protein